MIVHSAYEFFYVLFTMYFSHMIYSRIYTKNRLLSMQDLIGYVCSQFPALSEFIDQYLTYFLRFPCDVIFFMVTQGIPTLFSMLFVANYPTLRMFCLFLITLHRLALFLVDALGIHRIQLISPIPIDFFDVHGFLYYH